MLAAGLFEDVLRLGLDVRDDQLARVARRNRLRLAVDEILWCRLVGAEVDPRIITIAEHALAEPAQLDIDARTSASDRWIRETHREVLAVAFDGTGATEGLVALLREAPGDFDSADTAQAVRIVLCHKALRAGDSQAAGAMLAAIEARRADTPGDRAHLVSWLHARLAATDEPVVAGPILDHARAAWGVVHDQRRVFHDSVRARIDAEVASAERALLKRQVAEDPLTGLGNRRAYEAATLHGGAVIFVDVDRFKEVNDTHGHAVGDEALSRIAGALRNVTRAGDTVCRFGGDEFVVVAPGMPAHVAEQRAEAIVRGVLDVPWAEIAPDLAVSVSVGVGHGQADRETLAAAADAALYEVKARGGADWQVRSAG